MTDQQEENLLATVLEVTSTWYEVRKIPNHEVVVGEILFRKIFELAPGSWRMFSFGKGHNTLPDDFFKANGFQRHAKNLFGMLDAAINLLGPDTGMLKEILTDLGSKHLQFGIMPEHYPLVGQALLHTLEVGLADEFTPSVKKAWAKIFAFISRTMMEGASNALRSKLDAYLRASAMVGTDNSDKIFL